MSQQSGDDPREGSSGARVCSMCRTGLESGGSLVCDECFQGVVALPDLSSTQKSKDRCIFKCRATTVQKRALSRDTRMHLLHTHRIYAPYNARACRSHLDPSTGRIKEDQISRLREKCQQPGKLTRKDIQDLITDTKKRVQKTKKHDIFGAMPDSALGETTGFSRETIDELAELFVGYNLHNPRSQLCTYLSYMITGQAQRRLAGWIGIDHASVSRRADKVRQVLMQQFVPQYLEPEMTVEQRRTLIRHHTLDLANQLYDVAPDNIVVAVDGTYIWEPKSNNFRFQRLSFSKQKSDNFVRVMMVCTTKGWIVALPGGVWSARMGDGDIWLDIMRSDWFKELFIQGDVFVVDRGFERARAALETAGFVVKQPRFLERGASQLSTSAANESRECTVLRWVVEKTNGQFKRAKYFRQTLPIQSNPTLWEDLQIWAALHNAYGTRIEETPTLRAAVELVRQPAPQQNVLQRVEADFRLDKARATWTSLSLENDDAFPHLNYPIDFRKLGGPYVLELAKSYIADSLWGGDFELELHNHEDAIDWTRYGIQITTPLLVRARIQSRHQNSTRYRCYVLCDLSIDGSSAIKGYYCHCKAGARTNGACAHTMAIMWFLGYARHLETIQSKSDFLYYHLPRLPIADEDEMTEARDIEEQQRHALDAESQEQSLDMEMEDDESDNSEDAEMSVDQASQ